MNIGQRSFVDHLIEREQVRRQQYLKSREYYDGTHHTQLTDRMRQYLSVNRDMDFSVNYCPLIVNAKADRLVVTGFHTEDASQSDLFWQWWRSNRMDKIQGIVHLAAVRDGDAFVLVEWDPVKEIPRFNFEPAFAGEGVMVYYSEEHRDEIAFASKHWIIKHGDHTGKQWRKNLYLPDRIEKYIATNHSDGTSSNWLPYVDDSTQETRPGKLGVAGVHWWTDNGTETGVPLGIPIVHFKNVDIGDSYGISRLSNIIPIQDAVNKTIIDLLASADASGFGLLVGYGTDAWSNTKVGPGAIAAVSKSPSDAKLERLAGDDPRGLLSVYNALVLELARVSGTPLSYLQSSGQIAAEGTMKQQEVALVTQIEKSQVDFGNAWEDCMAIGRRLFNAFGHDESRLDTGIIIDTIWRSAESRNDKEMAETLAIKVEKLGVTTEVAQVELGYDATEIAQMERARLRNQALSIKQIITPVTEVPTLHPAGGENGAGLLQSEMGMNGNDATRA